MGSVLQYRVYVATDKVERLATGDDLWSSGDPFITRRRRGEGGSSGPGTLSLGTTNIVMRLSTGPTEYRPIGGDCVCHTYYWHIITAPAPTPKWDRLTHSSMV